MSTFNLSSSLSTFHLPLSLVVVITVVISIMFLFKRKKNKPESKPNIQPQVSQKVERPLVKEKTKNILVEKCDDTAQKKKLAEEYCDTLQEIENNRATNVYSKTFLHYAPLYQTLFGLYRRVKEKKEKMSDDWILIELEVALRNAAQLTELTVDGFSVKAKPKITDRERIFSKCMELEVEDLKSRLDDQQKTLRHEKSTLNFEKYLSTTGRDLYKLKEAFERKDVETCLDLAKPVEENLRRQGCLIFFADEEPVKSNPLLRRSYYEEDADTTELPGFFFKNEKGEYFLIEPCLGRRRKK